MGARSEGPLSKLADELGGDAYPLDATNYEEVKLSSRTLPTRTDV